MIRLYCLPLCIVFLILMFFQVCEGRGIGRVCEWPVPHLHRLLHFLRRRRGMPQNTMGLIWSISHIENKIDFDSPYLILSKHCDSTILSTFI